MDARAADRHTVDPVASKLIALSRNAQVNVDLDDPAYYWYRLGQRNAYAHAVGLVISRGIDQTAFEVSDRLTQELADGEVQLAALECAAISTASAATPPLDWIAPHPNATVVVVEGPVDALAIAAAAASAGLSDHLIPLSANGTAVSAAQAAQVCALAPAAIVLALDADAPGRAGTERWLDALTLQQHRIARITNLPDGIDPADWLAEYGPKGLGAFGVGVADPADPRPRMPGRELVRLSLLRARDPIRDTARELVAIARLTPRRDAAELLSQGEQEMARQGWNQRGEFEQYLRTIASHPVHDPLPCTSLPMPGSPTAPAVHL